MPEGTVICMMSGLALLEASTLIVYCICLARKYSRIEADRQCLYKGVIYRVIEVVYDRNDWFMRKVRLKTDFYPYIMEVLISDVRVVA